MTTSTTVDSIHRFRPSRRDDPFAGVMAALQRAPAFDRLRGFWESDHRETMDLCGTAGSVGAGLLALLLRQHPRPVLVLCAEPDTTGQWHHDLVNLLGESLVARFHAWETLPYEFRSPGPESTGRRLETLWRLVTTPNLVVVSHLRAALEPTLPPDELRSRLIELVAGKEHPLDDLLAGLVELGYRRTPLVEEAGTFACRGGIVDVFTYSESEPIRIEFFGDIVESIRTFSVSTQRTTGHRHTCVILPSREVDGLGPRYDAAWEQSKLDPSWRERLDADPERPGLEWLAGHLGNKRVRLFDYFSDNSVLWADDPDRLQVAFDRLMAEAERFHLRLAEHLPDPPTPKEIYGDRAIWHDPDHLPTRIWTHDLHVRADQTSPPVELGAISPPSIAGSVRRLAEVVRDFAAKNIECVIACDNEGQRKRLEELLADVQVPIDCIHPALHGGFVLPEAQFALLTEHEIFQRHRVQQRRRRFHEGVALSSYTQLKKADFVVHIDHGIGRYRGLEAITVEGRRRDCLLLLYQDQDKLYVPIEEFDRVQKYAGKEGKPALSKLGGTAWEKAKARTKKALFAMAEELIALYAARKSYPGVAFGDDGEWMRQMEGSFTFDETPDQITAIAAVKKDMCDQSSMDRLICGDVGYGKTEVAMRAAFRAVCDQKQAAVLVPTTILAQQHLTTFRERLAEFPVRIETLSRFRSAAEQKRVVAELAMGKVDVIIGTHRLLQKDVIFKDLGLLVIDEEHRFGVAHKERLRQLRQTVDTLALSATPIPRTLQMSLLGARDLSLINTPPRDRLPVQTEVRAFGPDVITEAILREVDRGGQVYFVHNRIQSIGAMTDLLTRLLPTVRIAVAHGQMPERDLESVMTRFYHHEFDVLLSTAIIESGLDLPSVNTIVIHRSDRFGLAELYQLRGRVGRAARQAYCYLLVPPSSALSSVAKARLRAIQEHTALGSGFHLAMRDMEIRGAGNLLGPQQHGFIAEVGFDLYCRLLDEAVAEARGAQPSGPPAPVQFDVDGDRFIPDDYISDTQQRFEMYKRLAEIADPAAVDDLMLEMTDRFGAPPEQARRLLDLARGRVWARRTGIVRVIARHGKWTLIFAVDTVIGRKQIETWRAVLGDPVAFTSGPPFKIEVRAPVGRSADLDGLLSVLEAIAAGNPVVFDDNSRETR